MLVCGNLRRNVRSSATIGFDDLVDIFTCSRYLSGFAARGPSIVDVLDAPSLGLIRYSSNKAAKGPANPV